MDNSETDVDAENTSAMPQAQHDPYPKMIIVCFLIAFSLLLVIIMVSLIDFVQREKGEEIKPKNPAFFEEHLRNTPAPVENEVL